MSDPTPTTSAERACVCCGAGVTRESSPDPWDGRLDAYCEPCAWARCDAYPHDAPRGSDLPDRHTVARRFELFHQTVELPEDSGPYPRTPSAERVAALEAVVEAARDVLDPPADQAGPLSAALNRLARALATLDEHA